MKKKIVLVIGIKGVGKSSILEGLEPEWRVINYGDLMVDLLKNVHRDKILELDFKTQREVQKKALDVLIKEVKKEKRNVIIDSHSVVIGSHGMLPGFPLFSLQRIKFDAIIMIKADPKEILERRKKDEKIGRKRIIKDVNEIEWEQKMEEIFGMFCAELSGCPFIIIENPSGKLEEQRKKLKEILSIV